MIRRTRVIPCLLLCGRELVKTRRFARARYVGDALNTVRILNEKEVDELLVLDIDATPHGRPPDVGLIRDIAGECFMPLTYGGGVTALRQMEDLFAAGCEKIVLHQGALGRPALVEEAARAFGSQSVSAVINAKKNFFGGYSVTDARVRKADGQSPAERARRLEAAGAGEIVIQSVDRDGTLRGYDLELVRQVTEAVRVPVVALGGAGSVEDFKRAAEAGASAVAAGSFFVFHGKHQAVLVTYPSADELDACLR